MKLRKLTAVLLTLAMVLTLSLSLTACNKVKDADNSSTTEITGEPGRDATTKKGQTAKVKNAIVIYFSRSGDQYEVGSVKKGNTAILAEIIAEEAGADLYELVPEDDNYPTDSYRDLTSVAKDEQEANARPAYKKTVPDLSKYDVIFLGAPVWWGDWPMIMYTFFENEDLDGKTLVPFNTHAGSGLSGFDTKLADKVPDATVESGFTLSGVTAQTDQKTARELVNEWLVDLPLK